MTHNELHVLLAALANAYRNENRDKKQKLGIAANAICQIVDDNNQYEFVYQELDRLCQLFQDNQDLSDRDFADNVVDYWKLNSYPEKVVSEKPKAKPVRIEDLGLPTLSDLLEEQSQKQKNTEDKKAE